MPKIVLIIFTCLILNACDKTDYTIKIDLGKEFELGLNEIAFNKKSNLNIQITDIQDSRCPTKVDCFWQGKASIFIALHYKQQTHTAELSIGDEEKNSIQIADLEIQLLTVSPYPTSYQKNAKEDKVVSLIVSKK